MMARFAAIVRVGPPLEDIYSVFAWLHGNAGQLGLDPARIGIKGESGGGGFAVSSDAIDAQRSGDFSIGTQPVTVEAPYFRQNFSTLEKIGRVPRSGVRAVDKWPACATAKSLAESRCAALAFANAPRDSCRAVFEECL
jgi:acetyl esterase/lipase